MVRNGWISDAIGVEWGEIGDSFYIESSCHQLESFA